MRSGPSRIVATVAIIATGGQWTEEWTVVTLDTLAGRAHHELSHRSSRLRAWRFEIGLLVATIVAGLFAWIARTVGYLPLDVELTRALQAVQVPWLGALLTGVTWIGFPPQSNVIFGAVIVALFLVGLRLEAALTLFAAAGSAGLWFLIEPIVDRPRPSPELVRVAMELSTGSFPSGHVLNLTAIFGFLIYLAVVILADVRWRTVLSVVLAIPILTIGVARIYDGAHWPSDVLGGYLIGGIWLGLTIQIYRWTKARLSGEGRPHDHASADGDAPGDRGRPALARG
jgi:undecaprenyl-diphosphatase